LVILLVIVVLGGAFAYAFTRPDKKNSAGSATTTTTTVSSLTPPTLPPPKPYKVTEGVNVRGAPTTASAVVAQIETGKTVTVICRVEGQSVTAPGGSSNLWLRVALFGGASGYVSSIYVETNNDIEDTKVIGVCGPG
jgi:uncharacterized protein YgiM (DUF1202 family)